MTIGQKVRSPQFDPPEGHLRITTQRNVRGLFWDVMSLPGHGWVASQQCFTGDHDHMMTSTCNGLQVVGLATIKDH